MLTDVRCRNAKAEERAYKLSDSLGLHLHVSTTGFRSWRFKYRFAGKEKRLVIGGYPEVTLARARLERDKARELLRDGRDPSIVRKQRDAAARVGAANTFEAIARQWHTAQKSRWTQDHWNNVLASLVSNVFPALGKLPINAITPPMVLEVIRAIENRPSIEVAKRVRRRMSSVFSYALAAGIGESDPAMIIKGALLPLVRGRFPALTKLEDARRFLQMVEGQIALPATKLASRFLALTCVRPGVLVDTPWSEMEDLDGEAPVWRIPAARMKLMRGRKEQAEYEFIIPLAPPAVAILRVALRLTNGFGLVFPGVRSAHQAMSENTLGKFYKGAEEFSGQHVPHGWRSTFSTIMNERAIVLDRPADRSIIDLMLAHLPKGVEGIYNRSAYLPRRRQLAEEWAELLLEGFAPAETLVNSPARPESTNERTVLRRNYRRRSKQGSPDVPARTS